MQRTKKARLNLPPNFQEKVLMNEIKLDSGEKSISTMRELLILYSIGTEYYDSINSPILVQHYLKKSAQMVSNPEYMSLIDKQNEMLKANPGIKNENDDALRKRLYEDQSNYTKGSVSIKATKKIFEREIFNDKSSDCFKTNHISDIDSSSDLNFDNPFLTRLKNKSFYNGHKNIRDQENEIINSQLKDELDKIEQKTHKIEENLNKDIDIQLENFQNRKKLKKNRKKQIEINILSRSSASTSRRVSRRGSKYDDVLESLVLSQNKTEQDIMIDILEHSERQLKMNQDQMQKEIDEFIEKSIKEMNDAIEELRLSYQAEFVEIDEIVFPDLLEELKSDMETEIEILREKYEELRNSETEKIKKKYLKKNEI